MVNFPSHTQERYMYLLKQDVIFNDDFLATEAEQNGCHFTLLFINPLCPPEYWFYYTHYVSFSIIWHQELQICQAGFVLIVNIRIKLSNMLIMQAYSPIIGIHREWLTRYIYVMCYWPQYLVFVVGWHQVGHW